MKKLMVVIAVLFFMQMTHAQVSGNINYQSQVRYPENNIELYAPPNSNFVITVKGLANIKADCYVAIFSVAQEGKTTEEINTLIDSRITQALSNLKNKPGVEIFVDMISFVPVYDYETEKKLFSKRTYNEIPKGFELKRNIHVKYTDPNILNEIMTSLAASEIYDLVRVDYFSDKMDMIKAELVSKSKLLLQDKIRDYRQILGTKIDSTEREPAEGFKIVYPVEMYKSYQAYSNSELNLKKTANVNQVEKSITLYYQPVVNKEFDFVINPTILEPVIQVMYEIRLEFNREKEIKPAAKEYFILTLNGDLKKINMVP